MDKAESEPELARTINADAPAVLAREAHALGAWLVHYGTDYVFDGSGSAPRRKAVAVMRSRSAAIRAAEAASRKGFGPAAENAEKMLKAFQEGNIEKLDDVHLVWSVVVLLILVLIITVVLSVSA